MYFYVIYVVSIIVSFAASLSIYVQREGDRYLRIFSPFLFITLLIEGSISLGWVKGNNVNNAIYNFFTVLEFTVYLFTLSEIIKNKRVKQIIRIFIYVYIPLALGNIIFIQKIYGFPLLTYALGCLVIVTVCIYYFFELFQAPKSVTLTRQPAFWICSGLLFFYCCSFPLFGPINLVRALPPFIVKNFLAIINILNVLLYSSFTIAFLCRLRTRKSMSLS